MLNFSFTGTQRAGLIILSVIGIAVVNGIYIHSMLTDPVAVQQAMSNRVALAFMAEALLLMILCVMLIIKYRLKRPGWLGFIILSIIGSLAFSIPLSLLLWGRRNNRSTGPNEKPEKY